MAQSIAARQRGIKQPRTEAEAKPTLKATPNGSGLAMQVPTSLWSSLSAQQDARGKMRIQEFEGNGQAPAIVEEELK